jgi:DegV family protein with EDD domain
VLYICVGSVYTGNYATALEWQNTSDNQGRFHIVDSGAASGRLALITLRTARFADRAESVEDVIAYAEAQCRACCEYVFINELQYLAAGGRISKTKSFFGDLLNKKPVISPLAHGVEKMGITRSSSEQLTFALDKLKTEATQQPMILLQYSDNRQWVDGSVRKAISRQHPDAEIIVSPLSMTSGVHMGPGTWAVAFSGAQ